MNKKDIAYCGLDCELCKSKFADIRQKVGIPEKAFEKVKIKEKGIDSFVKMKS